MPICRLPPHVVGDRQAVARLEFGGGLVHQHTTTVGRQQDRHVVMRRARHERQPVDPKQRRTDRGVEQTRVARARDLRGDLMLHPIDDDTGAGEQLVERFAPQRRAGQCVGEIGRQPGFGDHQRLASSALTAHPQNVQHLGGDPERVADRRRRQFGCRAPPRRWTSGIASAAGRPCRSRPTAPRLIGRVDGRTIRRLAGVRCSPARPDRPAPGAR